MTTPAPATPKAGIKARVRKVLASVAGAVTTPDAIKAEKALGVIVATRLLLSAGATAALVDFVVQLIQKA